MGRKNNYDTVVLPNLDKIIKWVKEGATNKAIAEKLGISAASFFKYLAEGESGNKHYVELFEAYAQARVIADEQIENALFKSAIGYTWTEHVRETITDPKGNITVKERTRTVDVPGSVPAQQFWLINKSPDKWKVKRETVQVEDSESGVIMLPEVKNG